MDAFASDSFWAHTRLLVHARLSSCGCSRSSCANTCPQMHLLCPHLKFWAKWPGYYLHWKTLESTARCMRLKRFPLGKRAEARYAGHRASEAPRGSWRVQEAAMFALSTLPLCPPPAARPAAFRQPESLTRDGLFLSILRRGYVYKATFNVSTAVRGSGCVYWAVPERCWESLVGEMRFISPRIPGVVQDGRNLFAQQVTRSSLPDAFKLCPRKTASQGVASAKFRVQRHLGMPVSGATEKAPRGQQRQLRDARGTCRVHRAPTQRGLLSHHGRQRICQLWPRSIKTWRETSEAW